MAKYIESYAKASDAKSSVIGDFYRIEERIPALSSNPEEAIIQVKEALKIKEELKEVGFDYNPGCFTLQDVLRTKTGNCLGIPLLVGSILGERGFEPHFNLLVTPHDYSYKLELERFEQLKEEIRYDIPKPATSKIDFPMYRFAPLEHLVVRANGSNPIETTSEEHAVPDCEYLREISFDEALSCVHKDRAARLWQAGRNDDGKKTAEEGLKLWGKNRQIYGLLEGLNREMGDIPAAKDNAQKFMEIGGNDSLYFSTLYEMTKDPKFIELALERYPAFANVLEYKMQNLAEKDPREARWLYALVSHMNADSQVLDFDAFVARNAKFAKPKNLNTLTREKII